MSAKPSHCSCGDLGPHLGLAHGGLDRLAEDDADADAGADGAEAAADAEADRLAGAGDVPVGAAARNVMTLCNKGDSSYGLNGARRPRRRGRSR